MIYELLEYTTVPGRMPALVRRFNEHTLRLFKQHDIDVVLISTTSFGENSNNELVYLLRFEDMAELERKWAAFQSDKDWQAARKASEEDGPIVAKRSRRVLDASSFEAAQ